MSRRTYLSALLEPSQSSASWAPLRRYGRRSVLGFLLPILGLLGGCSTETTPDVAALAPPDPALTTFEQPVAEALAKARQEVLDHPSRGAAWGRYGIVLHAHDLHREATTAYRQAARLSPADERWPYLAGLALENFAPNEALEAFSQAEALNPRHGAFFLNYGDALLEAADGAAARKRYAKALDLDAASPFAHFGLARVALLDGDLELARRHLSSALDLQDAYREAHTLMAQVQQRLGHAEAAQLHTWKAANQTRATAAADPVFDQVAAAGTSSVSSAQRGLAAANAGRYVEAVQEFRRVLDLRGDNPTDLAYYGAALFGAGRTEEALKAYDRALELDPTTVVALNNLGQAHLHEGELDAAERYLRTALEHAPDNREAHLNLALIYGRRGRLEDSRSHLQHVLNSSPGDAEALKMMAPLLLQMGQDDDALDSWLRLIDIQPHQLEALEQAVRLLVQRQRHGEAIRRLEQGLRIAPNSSRLALFLAWQLATAPQAELRDGPEAVILASRVRQAYPEQYQPADVLAAAHAQNGNFDDALREIDEALRLAARSEAPVLDDLEKRRADYAAGRPFRQ